MTNQTELVSQMANQIQRLIDRLDDMERQLEDAAAAGAFPNTDDADMAAIAEALRKADAKMRNTSSRK